MILGLNNENEEGMASSMLNEFARERVKNKSSKEAAEMQLANCNNMKQNKGIKRGSTGVQALCFCT